MDNVDNNTNNNDNNILIPIKDDPGFWDYSYLCQVFFTFWVGVIKKIIESLISVKVWMMVMIYWCTRQLVIDGKITGDNYVSVVTGLIGILVAFRSIESISILITDTYKKVKGYVDEK